MAGQSRLVMYTLGTAAFVALALVLRLPVTAGVIATPLIVRTVMIIKALLAARSAEDRAERKLLGVIVIRELALSALLISAAAVITVRFSGPRDPLLEVSVFVSLVAWAIARQTANWLGQLIAARRARETRAADEATETQDPGEPR